FETTGIETSNLTAGSIETGNLSVRNDINTQGQLQVGGGLTVGLGGIFSSGALNIESTRSAQLSVVGHTVGSALQILNELSDSDIFTASKSGVAKFTITNAGGIKLAA